MSSVKLPRDSGRMILNKIPTSTNCVDTQPSCSVKFINRSTSKKIPLIVIKSSRSGNAIVKKEIYYPGVWRSTKNGAVIIHMHFLILDTSILYKAAAAVAQLLQRRRTSATAISDHTIRTSRTVAAMMMAI